MKNRIRELRKEIQLTAKELGKRFGVGESTVSMWESGKNTPQAKTLAEMSELFGVSIEYILYKTDDRNYDSVTVPLKKLINPEDYHLIPKNFDVDGKYVGLIKEMIDKKISPDELKIIIDMYLELEKKKKK